MGARVCIAEPFWLPVRSMLLGFVWAGSAAHGRFALLT